MSRPGSQTEHVDAGVVLALDVGTSSCRASLYDLSGEAVDGSTAQIRYAPRVTEDGGAELDPDRLFAQVCAVVDEVLTKRGPRVRAVATDTFWHSLLGVDAAGRPLTPVYLWLDARSRGEMAALRDRLDERAVHARTGCVLHWTYWPARLRWLRRSAPEVCRQVARWISFGELLLERLTGQRGVSVSMASGTGLLDVHRCEWDSEVLAALELEPRQLSPIVPLTQTGVASRWSILKDVPWLPAVGDGACSNLGAGCTTPEHFALMVGTSGAERAAWSPPRDFHIPWGAWCYRVNESRVVVGGALNDGGSLLDWLHSALRLPDAEAAEAEVAMLPPDGHGLTVLPFWGGERNPGWADDARGAIVGLRLSTRPMDVLRACLEAVALRFGEIDRILSDALPGAQDAIATGGALLHSPAWMQIMADVLGRPVLASAEPEASSRGVALLALDALGLLGHSLEDEVPRTSRRFEPVPAHTQRYRAAAERQRRLYDAVLS